MTMTPEDLKRYREVAEASTPNLQTGLFRSDEQDDQVAQFSESLRARSPGECWMVVAPIGDGTPIEESALFAAITGNGPTSANNARFFAGARAAALESIDEIER